jgi:hypothetical protein
MLKKYKSPSSDQIPADLLERGCEILVSAIHKPINFIWNKEKLSGLRKETIILPIYGT